VVLAALAALVIAGVIIAALATCGKPYVAQQTLADGSVLTLVDMTVGHRHVSPSASWRERLGAGFPASWRKRLKLQTPPMASAEVSSNYLTVWIIAQGDNRGAARRWKLLVSDDRDNFCINNDSYSRAVSVRLGSNVWLQGLPMVSWPRRAEMLRIQLYPDTSSYPLKMTVEFRVNNPGRDQKTTPWKAAPWPVTVRDGDLEFTLRSLWVGLAWHGEDWKLRAQKDPLQRVTRGTFRVTKAGEVQTNWNAYHVREIRDATGNWSHGDGFVSAIRHGETMNQFGQLPLPVDEPWRMTVEFSRLSGFSPEELHTIKGFVMPKEGQPRLVVTNAIGKQRFIVQWEQPWLDKSPYQVRAWVEPEPRGPALALIRTNVSYKLTLVRATDDRGRDAEIKNHGGGVATTHDIVKLLPDATTVDLVYAYHPSRLITFQVKPEFYTK
jgi:hypothetical protein